MQHLEESQGGTLLPKEWTDMIENLSDEEATRLVLRLKECLALIASRLSSPLPHPSARDPTRLDPLLRN